ncbi:MAG: hypothetical protein ABIQ84_08780, partial [Usitatibacter sp.]
MAAEVANVFHIEEERAMAGPTEGPRHPTKQSQPQTDAPAKSERRDFLRKTMALTGASTLGGVAAAQAAPLEVPASNREAGRTIDEKAYGMPSKFEGHVKRNRSDVLKNRQNWSDWSMTPLQHQPGIITPNGLVFERHHAGTPDIDPRTHKL